MAWERPTLVIVATYNERNTLPELTGMLRQRFPRLDLLVVDDDSPDGTGHWCDEYATSDSQFAILHRRGPRGLGSATVDGIRWGLARNYEFLVTMDADLSHHPNDLQALLDRMAADPTGRLGVVIGSRYVPGGAIEGWPRRRRLASRWVNGLARRGLGLTTRDNTSAYRLYRSTSLKKIDLDRIASGGYAYLEEMLWRLKQAQVEMAEVPITFRDRTVGASKVRPSVIAKAGWHLVRMSWSHRFGRPH